MIIPIKTQLKGDTQPTRHYALVFDDVITPADFAAYRNALTTAVKNILTYCDTCDSFSGEMFLLLQLAEFIGTSLDEQQNRLTRVYISKLKNEITKNQKQHHNEQ